MGKADTGGKRAINIYNRAWVEWTLRQQPIAVEAELSGEFQFIARATDSLLQVQGQTGRFLALTELQFRYDRRMADRLTAYAALARQKYELDVFVTVVYLLPPPAETTIDTALHREFMGQVAHQDFQAILLWELEAEHVLNFNNPVLLPFVPLMQGGHTEQMVRKCAERIRQEPEAVELEAILTIFASYVLEAKVIKQILRWEMQIVQESPIVKELLERGREEGRQEGRQEGREEGQREATLKALHQTLTIRFEVELGQFAERCQLLDLSSLEQLHEAALKVQTLGEFEQVLAEALKEKS